MTDSKDIVEDLIEVLESRRSADPGSSYVASLYADGLNRILEKVGEEATEVVLAAKDATSSDRDDALVHEVADLWPEPYRLWCTAPHRVRIPGGESLASDMKSTPA